MRRRRPCRFWILFCLLAPAAATATGETTAEAFAVVRRIAVAEARQGVAVDDNHFYAISDRTIGKYDERTAALIARWDAGDDERIIHLNSGIVLDGKLYCAHSNYPAVPMSSSIEVFDAESLRHLHSHVFGVFEGSATWVDRHAGSWWVAFANYDGRGGQAGRGPEATSVVRFDTSWRVESRYRFPQAVVERFGDRSNSGGAWGADGRLYTTGHDAAEVYVLQLPDKGDVLELVEIVAAGIEGQGIAWARSEPPRLWGIRKSTREVVVLARRG
jgi:hypothetical protein